MAVSDGSGVGVAVRVAVGERVAVWVAEAVGLAVVVGVQVGVAGITRFRPPQLIRNKVSTDAQKTYLVIASCGLPYDHKG